MVDVLTIWSFHPFHTNSKSTNCGKKFTIIYKYKLINEDQR